MSRGERVSAAAHDAGQDGPPAGPPPWLNETMQQSIEWRDGDIVVSVPPKSGTTWTMNIVHQLRSGGDPAFADIYAEVPWLEIVPRPDSAIDGLIAAFDAMPSDKRRAFKSHAAPPTLPFQHAGAGLDVRYVVVARNPDEAVASFRPFIAAHSDAWFDLWHVHPNTEDTAERWAGLVAAWARAVAAGRLSGRPWQTWLVIEPTEPREDAAYLHTPNPNRDNFLYPFEGVEWGAEPPGWVAAGASGR